MLLYRNVDLYVYSWKDFPHPPQFTVGFEQVKFVSLCLSVIQHLSDQSKAGTQHTNSTLSTLPFMRRREAQAAKTMEKLPYNGSKFFAKVASVPLVGLSLNKISEAYTKTKDNTGFIARTIVIAETVTWKLAESVAPLAQKMPLSKIDDLACQGFEKFETVVPQVKKQPEEIVTDTKTLIHVKVAPVVQIFNSTSEAVCQTFIAKKAFDVCDYMLGTASRTLDVVLPPTEQEKSEQNGTVEKTEPVEGNERPYQLALGAWTLVNVFTKRLFGVAQARVEHAAATTDVVIKSAQKAFSRPTNTS